MEGGLPQLDPTWFPSQLFWLALAFVVLYMAISRSLAPSIQEVLETRDARIKADLDRAANLKTQAAHAQENYETELKKARHTAQSMLAGVTSSIKQATEQQTADLDKELATETLKSETQIAKAREAALRNLTPVATEVSGKILEILLHKKIDSATIADALNKLDKEFSA